MLNRNKMAFVLALVAIVLIASAFSVNESAKLLRLKDAPLDCHLPNDANSCPLLKNSVEPPVIIVYVLSAILIMISIYLFFFNREESFTEAINALRQSTSKEEKFQVLMQGLDEFEQNAVKTLKSQDGIKQGTLAIKTNMSKAKLSAVLSGLERKGLITRIDAGRSKKVFLKIT